MKKTIAASLLFGVGLVFGFAADYVAKDRRPPVVIHSTEALNSPVVKGGRLVVRIVRDKVRFCPLESVRTAIDENGRAVHLESRLSRGGDVSADFVDVDYNVSSPPPGRYLLRVALTYFCSSGKFYIRQPDTPFLIVGAK